MHPLKKSIVLLFILGTAQISCAAVQPKLCHRQGSYRFEILVDGKRAPTFQHRGETYLLGAKGKRYVVRVYNQSAKRVEAVVTVDGRDVMDGKPGNYHKRGYLIPAYGSVDIDGWRLSRKNVAAFRFSGVDDSYAAQTGNARNVGVIGVAIFKEKQRRPIVRRWPQWRASGEVEEAPATGLGSKSRRSKKPTRNRSLNSAEVGSLAEGSMDDADRLERKGLGTAFGEKRYSAVRHVAFKRRNPQRPDRLLGLRYNDRSGLIALGIKIPRPNQENWLRRTASPFPAQPEYAAPPPGWEG